MKAIEQYVSVLFFLVFLFFPRQVFRFASNSKLIKKPVACEFRGKQHLTEAAKLLVEKTSLLLKRTNKIRGSHLVLGHSNTAATAAKFPTFIRDKKTSC